MRGWNTSLYTPTLSSPFIYKFSLLMHWQPLVSYLWPASLGCNKVSMQLKIHFLLPTWQITALSCCTDTHIYSHTRTNIAFVTYFKCYIKCNMKKQIMLKKKAIINRFYLCWPERVSNTFIPERKYLPQLCGLACVITTYYVRWFKSKN